MKSIRHKSGILHVETPLGIINVRIGLTDHSGRAVESIEVIPNNYAGEPAVYRRGPSNVRLVQSKTQKGDGRRGSVMSTQGKTSKDPFATPYYVDVNEDGLHYEVRGKNAHGMDATVARCVLLVNAEFIRDACNERAKLIAVLKAAERIEIALALGPLNPLLDKVRAEFDALRSTIAEARGER